MAQREHKAEPGDLIEFKRPGYQHWGVYVGNDEVVHLTSPDNKGSNSRSLLNFSSSGSTAQVKRENLQDVAGTSRFQVNNLLDGTYKPRQQHVIVEEACNTVGRMFYYSPTAANCEHYATHLRYGRGESRQVLTLVAAHMAGGALATAAGFTAPSGVLLGGVAHAIGSWFFK